MKILAVFARDLLSHLPVSMLLALSIAMLTLSCSYHPPAPIEPERGERRVGASGTYTVKTGDTLYGIAFSYGLDHLELARWNGISSPYVIYPGQTLRLRQPATAVARERGTDSVRISTVKSPSRSSTRDIAPPPAPEKAKPVAPEKPAAGDTDSSTVKEAVKEETVSPQAKTSSPLTWRWPTQGQVKRAFVAGDPARNGLDIAGREGQPVIATAPGQVVYSGNGLIGYGELIIIKHDEQLLSAYAHNKVRLVHEGERVQGGQKIAELGRNAAGDEVLHFEIRVQGKPVNPLNYLPKK